MICKYCIGNAKKGVMGASLSTSSKIVMFIDDIVINTIVTDSDNHIVAETRVPIKYCPACGKRLRGVYIKRIIAKLKGEEL